jgi:2-keto-3-deoxy-L-rhamnonate aldolase RhmA
MDGIELKSYWNSGKPSFGAWVTCTDPTVAAVICNIGYDWVLIDAEHHPFNAETLREIIAVVHYRGVVPIVRVTTNDAALIKQTLDFGAEGILVPLLHTEEDARHALASCRYPPNGIRGFNPRDASNFFKDIDHYLNTINERVIAMLQVEHIDAVNNLDKILALSGLDAIFIGPADLSNSMGFVGQPSHPEVQEVINKTIDKCNAVGVPVGISIDGPAEALSPWFKRGINFMTIGADYDWITAAGSAILNDMRKAVGGR